MKHYKNDFPIFTHNKDLIYLDSAATTQKPQVVMEALGDYYQNYNANIHRGIYPIAEKATAKVEDVREKVRSFINAQYKEEIIFTKSTTEAINLIAQTWGREHIKQGDTITVPISEHHANFVPWQQLCLEKNATFETVELARLSTRNSEKRKLFAVSHISNVLGTINPIEKMVREQKDKNNKIKVLIDAAQSIAHTTIDVQKIDCDFLAFSGHKMFAETGVGVLYVKREILEKMKPFLFGGDMVREVTKEKTIFADIPSRFEAGTLHISGIISLGTAIDYINTIGLETIQKHEKNLTEYCLGKLNKIDGISILGNRENKSGIISFTIDDVHPHDIAQILGDQNICLRAGHHCAMPLHTSLGIPASARISFSVYNTEEDIDTFIEEVKKIKKMFS